MFYGHISSLGTESTLLGAEIVAQMGQDRGEIRLRLARCHFRLARASKFGFGVSPVKIFGLKTVLAAGALALFGSQAGATSLTCPANPTEGVYRYLNLDYTDTISFELTCLAWGVGDGDADKTFQENQLQL